jgi:hypothetical protein
MHAAQLRAVLGKGDLLGDNLRDAAAVCNAWYTAEPSLATFVMHTLMEALLARNWGDEQGVPASHYQPFQSLVLPGLIQVVDILVATPAAEPIDELDALVIAYRDCLRATP